MNEPSKPPNPLATAMEWVAKITTVALEMVLPAILASYFGKGWVLPGLAIGLVIGIWHLIQMTRPKSSSTQSVNKREHDERQVKQ